MYAAKGVLTNRRLPGGYKVVVPRGQPTENDIMNY